MSEYPTSPAQPASGPLDRTSVLTATTVTLVGVIGRLVPVQAEPVTGRRYGGLVILGPHGYGMDEARDRISAGTINAGLSLPTQAMRASFLPSNDPAPGSEVDLAVAAILLATAGLIPAAILDAAVLIGEVGLDGAVRGVRGVLAMVDAAARHGIATVVVPAANAIEAQLIPAVEIVAVDSLQQFVAWASTGHRPPLPKPTTARQSLGTSAYPVGDLAHVPAAWTTARWALEVAAAGGHHLGMVGPVGTGTTMLAHCLPSLLPDLDDEAALEVTALRSAAGIPAVDLVRRPPLREPHHTTSETALVGGGPRLSIPGAVSLAHHGVLFADNAPEFRTGTLRALRRVLECRQAHLFGAGRRVSYPARFQLVLAAQPCPCVNPPAVPCPTCTALCRRRYLARMAQLWHHTDIRLYLDVPAASDRVPGESSAVVATRVARARELAADRWADLGVRINADVPGKVLRTGVCRLPTSDINPLLRLVSTGAISDDGHERVLRLAWTISDLRGADRPDRDDVTAAIDLYLDQQS